MTYSDKMAIYFFQFVVYLILSIGEVNQLRLWLNWFEIARKYWWKWLMISNISDKVWIALVFAFVSIVITLLYFKRHLINANQRSSSAVSNNAETNGNEEFSNSSNVQLSLTNSSIFLYVVGTLLNQGLDQEFYKSFSGHDVAIIFNFNIFNLELLLW